MKKILLVTSALLFATPALAQHVHHKGPNGGPMEDVAGVHVEMTASGKTLTFHVLDDANKAISTTGYSASALLTNGSERETMSLTASGHTLKGEAKADIVKGTAVSITLKTADGKSGQAKFKY
ncbi:hypothetical protein RPMA_20110 [Tardiphaga alba]|uniref:CHRD domain-containing protein n=1 Tax=Tardiphaga alba TaxID=340268 RepID=A0ABX8AER9_9BRAD|nr:hypothetical protein [Tardiphaga alba]QUS40885.1 hypothetical protein RPMA_20110 [Tardiphaga alba]